MRNTISFRWLGIAGIEIHIDDFILAIDPLFSRPRLPHTLFGKVPTDPFQGPERIPRYDVILVTHAHYDHLMDVPLIARQYGSQVYGSANTCFLTRLHHIPGNQVHEVQPGTSFSVGPCRVQAVPSLHLSIPLLNRGNIPPGLKPPLRLREYRLDQCYSYQVEVGSVKILDLAGSSAQQSIQADLIFAGWDSEAYLSKLLENGHPNYIVPIHWENLFQPITKPVERLPIPPAWLLPGMARKHPLQIADTLHKKYPQLQVLIPERFVEYDINGAVINPLSKPPH